MRSMATEPTQPIRATFGAVCLGARIALDIRQEEVAARAGISRGYLSRIERGVADPTLDVIQSIADILGITIQATWQTPTIASTSRVRDLVHGRCLAYADRRLTRVGLVTAREVLVEDGRSRGWIDLLAFDPRTRTLYLIEIKTRLDDLGGLERQLGMYERLAGAAAHGLGWDPAMRSTWLLALASDEAERAIRDARGYFARAFPQRAPTMAAALADPTLSAPGRGLALIDPSSRRRDWLIRSAVDGRRSPARYRDYADAARRAAA